MLIAIDHGNHGIKTVHHNFVSGLARHSVRPPMADEVLEYQGEYWTLSGHRLPYRRDKTRDESFFILTLFAIAKELAYAGPLPAAEKIDLAVGLPPEHYGILKDKFRDYFKRNESIQFSYNDKPITIMIRDVFVYPQAFAAIAPHTRLRMQCFESPGSRNPFRGYTFPDLRFRHLRQRQGLPPRMLC